jgi:hypothetical protein
MYTVPMDESMAVNKISSDLLRGHTDGAMMDKLAYAALKGLEVLLSRVTII